MLYIKFQNMLAKFKKFFTDESFYVNKKLHDYYADYEYEIDDITFNDLMLLDFSKKYNHSLTSCGDEVFYHWLRSIKSQSAIITLQNDLKILRANSQIILIQHLLSKIGKQKRGNIINDLWEGFTIKSKVIDYFYFLFILNTLISIFICIANFKLLPLSIIVFCLFNLLIYISTNTKISKVSGSINYLLLLCGALKKINKKTKLELSIKKPNYNIFSRLTRYVIFFKDGIGGPESGDLISVIIDYLRIFLCYEIFSFKRASKIVISNIEAIHKIIYFVGYIDCLINSKKIMDQHQTVYSQIDNQQEISFKEMIHPLLSNSVAQTKNIRKGFIITGLNMSGKTTFMKSFALNQLLATSFGFCFAQSFRTNIISIMTSFRINDDLLNGKSRYYAEAYRLLEISNQIKKDKTLCLVDEILSGTNSNDRIYGATLILKNFSNNINSIVIAATHDNMIAESLSELLSPAYFDGEIHADQINFDYKIKDGIVSKRNGLLILKLIGLQIIENFA